MSTVTRYTVLNAYKNLLKVQRNTFKAPQVTHLISCAFDTHVADVEAIQGNVDDYSTLCLFSAARLRTHSEFMKYRDETNPEMIQKVSGILVLRSRFASRLQLSGNDYFSPLRFMAARTIRRLSTETCIRQPDRLHIGQKYCSGRLRFNPETELGDNDSIKKNRHKRDAATHEHKDGCCESGSA
ncbi:hypothetical protein BC938DRAFT_478045 [Jimgerdemannia flammicorona]|uniref:Uncharacterized protein n=1 Tax=Jimgerdemannia flammicorona TaxID=994334 RepID=A0A433QYN0_9FUNG|nr:hypothetical protein BC938DRAFT_478045 [Jimgerdemannia flammicorona]